MVGKRTRAVPELEAQMGASEAVDRDGQLDHFTPARAVVVVEDKRTVFTDTQLSWAQANAVLKKNKVQIRTNYVKL